MDNNGIIMDNWDNNHWLVVDLPLPKILVNGKDDIPYMTWKIKNVPNHQPAYENMSGYPK